MARATTSFGSHGLSVWGRFYGGVGRNALAWRHPVSITGDDTLAGVLDMALATTSFGSHDLADGVRQRRWRCHGLLVQVAFFVKTRAQTTTCPLSKTALRRYGQRSAQ